MRLTQILEENELMSVVDGTDVKVTVPAKTADEILAWERKDRRARSILISALDKTMMPHTIGAKSAHAV